MLYAKTYTMYAFLVVCHTSLYIFIYTTLYQNAEIVFIVYILQGGNDQNPAGKNQQGNKKQHFSPAGAIPMNARVTKDYIFSLLQARR